MAISAKAARRPRSRMNFDVNKDLADNPRAPARLHRAGRRQRGTAWCASSSWCPYVGACIHVPPPPPNQMVYVKSAAGISLKSVHEAYWVTGKMRVEQTTTNLGAAAYALDADKIEQYQY